MPNKQDINNPSVEQKENKPSSLHKPGKLNTQVSITLNTYDSQSLFTGNRKAKRIGLIPFASRMTEIWYATMKDDPYADWFLLKIYDKLIKLQQELNVELSHVEDKLHLSPIHVEPFPSKEPIERFLWFRTQYGYLAASLIVNFDRLMRLSITAERIGILLDAPHAKLRTRWLEKIGSILNLPKSWQAFSITREDIKHKTNIVEQAEVSMGKLPKVILEKSIRSPFAPHINETSKPIEEDENNE